jgi:hypothetical protein
MVRVRYIRHCRPLLQVGLPCPGPLVRRRGAFVPNSRLLGEWPLAAGLTLGAARRKAPPPIRVAQMPFPSRCSSVLRPTIRS